MRRVVQAWRSHLRLLLAMIIGARAVSIASAALTVLGVQYQQDNPYPEFQCIWHDRNYPTSCGGVVTGANVHVYLKNTGSAAVTVNDVTLAGYSLATVIQLNSSYHDAQSIYFHWDTPPQDILNAGEPVWYKGDPANIPAGGVAQAVVRLRSVPVTPTVSVGVLTSGGTVAANIPVDANAPQLASVGFASDLTRAYLHWRRNGGAAPTSIRMDGVDVTGNAVTVGDASVNFAESVLTLNPPLVYMSYHVFQGVYADGKTATASLRAWAHPFIYASWSVFPCAGGDTDCARAWVKDAVNHGFNAVQNQLDSGGIADFLGSCAGQAYAANLGYGFITWKSDYTACAGTGNPLLSFLDDEPDAEEDNLDCGTGLKLPCGEGHTTGVLAMRNIATGETFRSKYPLAPTTVNMDGTLKPDNYYSYGQAVDVLQVDPYYQRRLADTYWYYPQRIPLYRKATYNYAVARAVTTAAEPNPSHVILYSCEWKDTSTGNIWPFPTPESKRIEVYYSLAAGAKGITYWWFKPGYPSNGLGDQSKPEARALWKEMGLLGNEIKTASPLLVASHPVDMTLTPSTNVWARALAVGTDTMILLVGNDDYYNDQAGCHYTPVGNARVTATLPSWMQASPTAFEITAGGLSDVSTALNGNQLQVNLGTLNLTRMIILTTNPQLRPAVQQRYDQQVQPGICAIAPELCVTCSAPTLLNGSFEGPASAVGVGTNWIGYQRPPYPTTVWSLQTASPPTGGGLQYQQIANTTSAGGGGVRQDVTGCAIGATYQISGWMRGNSISYSTCTVKCSTSASTNWSTAIDLNPPQTYTGNGWTSFSGTVVATGTNMTIWLDGQTGGSGQNKAECFDLVTVTCIAPAPPLYFGPAELLPSNEVRLVVNSAPGCSVTIQQSSDLVTWFPLTNFVDTNGTAQITDAIPTNSQTRFYRARTP